MATNTPKGNRPSYVYPTTANAIVKNPIRYLSERVRYVKAKEGASYVFGHGSHSILQYGFNELARRKKEIIEAQKEANSTITNEELRRILSDEFVNFYEGPKGAKKPQMSLRRSLAYKAFSRPQAGPTVSGSDWGFINSVMRTIGREAFSDPAITILPEYRLSYEGFKGEYNIAGNIDLLLLWDYKKNDIGKEFATRAVAIDWKSFDDEPYTNFKRLESNAQRAMYTTLASVVYGTENVDMLYVINRGFLTALAEEDPELKQYLNGRATRNLFFKMKGYDRRNMTVMNFSGPFHLESAFDLTELYARKTGEMQQLLSQFSPHGDKKMFTEVINSLLNDGEIIEQCGGNCKYCYIREVCPKGKFIESVAMDPFKGEASPMTNKQVRQIILENDISHTPTPIDKLTGRLPKKLPYTGVEALKAAEKNIREKDFFYQATISSYYTNEELIKVLKKSGEYAHQNQVKFMMKRFFDPKEKISPQLPFALTDPDIHLPYLNESIKTSIESSMREYISFVSRTVGLGEDSAALTNNMILEHVLSNRKVAATLIRSMYQSTVESVKQEVGSELAYYMLPIEKRNQLLHDATRSFTKNVLLTTFSAVDERIIDIVQNVHGVNVFDKLLTTPEKREEFFKTRNLRAIFDPEALSGIEEIAEKYSRRVRSSTPRVPVIPGEFYPGQKLGLTMLGAAGALIWALNHLSYAHQLRHAAMKAIGTAERQNDRKIEAMDHYSSYKTVRRLLFSDFGSETRTGVLKPSRFLSEVTRTASEHFTVFKDIVTRAYATVKGNASEIARALSLSIDEQAESMLISSKEYAPTRIGFAIGLLTALVPIIASFGAKKVSGEQGKVEERKKRLKRFKKQPSYSRSGMRIPESDIREAYKFTTPFGSVTMRGIYMTAFSAFRTVPRTIEGIAKLMSRWKDASATVSETSSVVTNLLRSTSRETAALVSAETTAPRLERNMLTRLQTARAYQSERIVQAHAREQVSQSIERYKGSRKIMPTHFSSERIRKKAEELINEAETPIRIRETKKQQHAVIPRKKPKPRRHLMVSGENGNGIITRLTPDATVYYTTSTATPITVPPETVQFSLSRKIVDRAMTDITQAKTLHPVRSTLLEAMTPATIPEKPSIPLSIAHQQPASGSSIITARAVANGFTVNEQTLRTAAKELAVAPYEFPSVSGNAEVIANKVARLMTTKTRSLARSYSYGGWKLNKYRNTLFGEI